MNLLGDSLMQFAYIGVSRYFVLLHSEVKYSAGVTNAKCVWRIH